MKILITGAQGFIGKNLISELRNQGFEELLEFDLNLNRDKLEKFASNCNFVFHLAGVNRPKNTEEFMKGNFGFTSELLDMLKKHNNQAPVLVSSSIQAELDNPYGQSKKAGEDLMFEYSEETNSPVFVYRLPNVFGKWSEPNYNSAVATFCNNIANNLSVQINDRNVLMKLVYIDDVVREFINKLKNFSSEVTKKGSFEEINPVYEIKLGDIVDLINTFKESRETLQLPDFSNPFIKKLYSTYLSYLPENEFIYALKMNIDNRGSFTEFIKSPDRGQVSINISKPYTTKGNHWHHTKNEKFLVVNGKGVVRFRKIGTDKIFEYYVSGEKLEVIDVPVGYTHNIENIGDTDMVTIMWVNEIFDKETPDTYFLEV